VGHLLFILRIIVPVLLFIVTMLILRTFTGFNWIVCIVLGAFVASLDVLIFMPYAVKSVQKSQE